LVHFNTVGLLLGCTINQYSTESLKIYLPNPLKKRVSPVFFLNNFPYRKNIERINLCELIFFLFKKITKGTDWPPGLTDWLFSVTDSIRPSPHFALLPDLKAKNITPCNWKQGDFSRKTGGFFTEYRVNIPPRLRCQKRAVFSKHPKTLPHPHLTTLIPNGHQNAENTPVFICENRCYRRAISSRPLDPSDR
jgi:hypothetical protein